MKHYAAVISHAPLVFEPSAKDLKHAAAAGLPLLRHVDTITATAYLPSENEMSEFRANHPAGRYLFRIDWQFWKDGEKTLVKFSQPGTYFDYDELHDPFIGQNSA